jgi:glycosyltransferase involved in cell wall biosynthesis
MRPNGMPASEVVHPPIPIESRAREPRSIKVLHVEVGGSFGGSLRILETYLRHADTRHAIHDLLFYYPTPGAKSLAGLVRNMFVLRASAPREQQTSLFSPSATGGAPWNSDSLALGFGELRRFVQLPMVLKTIGGIVSLLRRENYDVAHINNTFSYQAPTLLAARWTKTPTIAHVRNPVPRSKLNRALLHYADLVVTMNRSLERELRSWDVPVPVRTCRDGVELPEPDPSAALDWRAKLAPRGGILVGSVGQLQPQKGFDDFIRAARLVIASIPNVRFAIAGSGPLQSSLETLITELGLQHHFRLCGFQSDAVSFLSALDLFVCSSHWEGGPLVVCEAMLLGKPVVATDAGWNRELIESEGAGRLVPTRNPRALAAAIVESLANRAAMAVRAEKQIPALRQRSDPAWSSRQTDAWIREVCERERSR